MIYDVSTNSNYIPLVVRTSQPASKYRIPFRNMGSQDAEIDFTFVKVNEDMREGEINMTEFLDFYCVPNSLKIGSNGQAGILNVLIKSKF